MLTKHDLGLLEDVPFASLQLDPNNPRIAPKPAPGYQDAGKLFDPAVQKELTGKVYDAYSAEDLEKTITSLGWAPVDPTALVPRAVQRRGTRERARRSASAPLPAATSP